MSFEEKEKNINTFVSKVKKLMIEHYINIVEYDNYDGEENYCGTDIHFSFKEDIFFPKDVYELLK